MSFPVLEHVAKSARHTTFYLSCGAAESDADRLRARLAGACRSRGASSCRRSRPWAFAPSRPTCAATDGRASIRGTRTMRSRRSSPTWSSFWARSGRRRRSGSATIGDRRSSGRSPSTIRSSATASPIFACPTSPKVLQSRPSFRWPTGASIPPTSFRRRSGTISCSTARISPPPRPASRATSARRSGRCSAPAIRRAEGKPAPTAFTRANGGWFRGPDFSSPDVPRDPAVLSEEDERRYAAALERNGFFGPDSWYMNWSANLAYAGAGESATGGWTCRRSSCTAPTTTSARRWSRASPSRCAPIATI